MTTKDFILLGAGYAAGRMSKKMQAGPIGATTRELMKLTSNQYYKGLNNRFEKRVSKLRKAGFKYDKSLPGFYPKKSTYDAAKRRGAFLHNQFVMHADERAFREQLQRIK